MATTKGFRLHEAIRKQFEDYCRVNLLDERAVIEAWILQFLEANADQKQKAASRYTDWMTAHSGVATGKPNSRPSAKAKNKL